MYINEEIHHANRLEDLIFSSQSTDSVKYQLKMPEFFCDNCQADTVICMQKEMF